MLRGVGADDATPDHHDFGAWDTWYAGEQRSTAAVCLLEMMSSDLNRHPPSDLAHRRQERQRAVVELHGFVCDRLNMIANECLGKRRVSGEMEIGEQHLLGMKEVILGGNRFLDLDDHLRPVKDLCG